LLVRGCHAPATAADPLEFTFSATRGDSESAALISRENPVGPIGFDVTYLPDPIIPTEIVSLLQTRVNFKGLS